MIYHAAFRLLEGELVLLAAADAEAWIQPSAISAASSLALLRFLPSYQNRAATVCPLIVTREDQAVRPPAKKHDRQWARNTRTMREKHEGFLLQLGWSCAALHSRPGTRPQKPPPPSSPLAGGGWHTVSEMRGSGFGVEALENGWRMTGLTSSVRDDLEDGSRHAVLAASACS